MLYLAMIDTKKWTGRKQDWSMIRCPAGNLLRGSDAQLTIPPEVKGRCAVDETPMDEGAP